jgi:hypothetical protein
LPISEFRESYQALIKLLVHNYRREDWKMKRVFYQDKDEFDNKLILLLYKSETRIA